MMAASRAPARDTVGTSGIASSVLRSMKVLLTVASAVVLVASCTGTEQAPTPPVAPSVSSSGSTPSVEPVQPVTDSASFVAALEAAGHTVRQGGDVDLVGFEGLASSGRKVSID